MQNETEIKSDGNQALGCLILLVMLGGFGFGGYWIYDSVFGGGTLFAEDAGSYISPADLHEYGPNFDGTLVSADDTEYVSSEGEEFRVFGQLFIEDKTTANLYQPGNIDSDFMVVVDFSNLTIEERREITDHFNLEGVIVEGTLAYPGVNKTGKSFVWTRTLVATSITRICSNSQSKKRPVRR